MEKNRSILPWKKLLSFSWKVRGWPQKYVKLPNLEFHIFPFSQEYLKHKVPLVMFFFNPRRHKPKKVTRRHKWGGGRVNPDTSPLLLTPFIQLTRYLAHIMSVFLWYFQLIETTCCLIGLHGNHSNIMMSLAAAVLDFQIFNSFFIFKFKHWKDWENNF